jgi:hypothetical protein
MEYKRGEIPKDPVANLERMKSIYSNWQVQYKGMEDRYTALEDRIATCQDGLYRAKLMYNLDELNTQMTALYKRLTWARDVQIPFIENFIEEEKIRNGGLTQKPFADALASDDGEPLELVVD